MEFDLVLEIGLALSLLPFLYLINRKIFKVLKRRHEFFSEKLMHGLSLYHLFFAGVYYTYASFNPSDSHRYFNVPQNSAKSWWDFADTGTGFIDFISYPFINFFGFGYEMMMVLFSWIGFLGFVYAYLVFRENINLRVKVFKKIDLLYLILFLPNMHFWTASLGKGAPIFLGLMLFAYAIRKPGQRFQILALGSLLVFCIRPHIFLMIAMVSFLGILIGKKHIAWKQKLFYCLGIASVILIFRDQILAVANLGNSQNLIADFISFTSKRAGDLSHATSGLAMNDYSLPEKLFAFWFRPLFLDAPGFLGIIVSAENLLYLLLFVKIFKKDFFQFIKIAPTKIKMSLVLFLSATIVLSLVMSNLGIIIRQKTMIMYFLFFVIYAYLGHLESLKINKSDTNY